MFDGSNKDFNLNYKLKEQLSDFCKSLNFDGWNILMLNRDKRYAFVFMSSMEDSADSLNIQSKVFFDISKEDSYLCKAINESKIVIYDGDFKNDTQKSLNKLIEENASEMYIPINSTRSNNNIPIACIYLFKKSAIDNNVNNLIKENCIICQMGYIESLVQLHNYEYVNNRRFFNIIHTITEIIRTREPYMRDHPYNVAYYSNIIGVEMKLNDIQLYKLYISSLLHDVGKLYVPEYILNKTGQLTEEEFLELQNHPIHSGRIVEDLIYGYDNLLGVDEIVLNHHERYDGTGYPNGIKGDDIPLESRIISIADAVDAMLCERSYKKPKKISEAIQDLKKNRGSQFDPQFTDIMINRLIRRQEDREKLLEEPVISGTMEFLTETESYQLQGTLIKTEFAYRFKVSKYDQHLLKQVSDPSDIKKVSFYTEVTGTIFEYGATIMEIKKAEVYISKLTPKVTKNAFSLPWLLDGIIGLKNNNVLKITINKVGGNYLDFYILDEDYSDVKIFDDVNMVRIKFEEEDIIVSGKIDKKIKVGRKLRCTFIYLNILEGTRDTIFKHIFRKQTAFTRSLNNMLK